MAACDDDSYSIAPPNSSKTLGFKNYLGNSQNIHPKVLYFPEGWNGWEYWMAYTPYPDGGISAENPCIAVSKDGYSWTVPEGLVNPLDRQPSYGYNSDTHLVYREDTDEMEIWWRDFNELTKMDSFLRRVSRDGVNWSPEERIIPFPTRRSGYRLSPAVLVKENRYLVYYSDGRYIYKMESGAQFDVSGWGESKKLDIPYGDVRAWHLDVIENPETGLHEMLICGYLVGDGNNSADLYYCTYNPETGEASSPELILSRANKKNAIDHRSIYRSSIIRLNGYVRIYYSCIDKKWRRHMSVTEGPLPSIYADLREWGSRLY